ncbi:MAG: restriction endonuclease subunit S [Ktedonobacteraceae bacterium]
MSSSWQSLKLVEFVKIQRGHDLPEHDRKSGEIPIMGSFGITGYHNVAKVKGPGVTIGRSGASIGVVCYVPDDYWPLNTALYVTDFNGNDAIFAYYFLKTLNLPEYNSGSAQPSLNRNYIYPMQVKIPPYPEQHVIAMTLRDVDALIASLDKLIAKKRNIKQATMQQLLTGKTRLPGFSGEWEVKNLKNECEVITKGTTPTSLGKNFTTQGINFIKIESLTDDGYIIWDKLAFIDEETHNLLRRSQLKNKDILFSIAGALGRTTLVKQDILPANTNQALALIRLKDQSCIDHLFLTKYLTSPEIIRHIGSINVQAAQANLSLEDIRNFEIRVPPISEQQAITAILIDMDAEIAALEQKRDKTRALKQGMMQELLTGKTRLI